MAGGNNIGNDILAIKQEQKNTKIQEKVDKVLLNKKAYDEKQKKAHLIICDQPDYMRWNASQIYTVNQSLKREKSDGVILKKKALGLAKYIEWKDRATINWDQIISDLRDGKSNIDDDDDYDDDNVVDPQMTVNI